MLPESEALEKAQQVYDLMAETGLSFTAACAELGFYKMQFHRWREKYPSVEEIITRALDKRQAVWERKLIDLANGDLKGNPAAVLFGLKNTNHSEWHDSLRVEATTKTENNFALEKLTDDELLQLQNLLDKQLGVQQIEYQEPEYKKPTKSRKRSAGN